MMAREQTCRAAMFTYEKRNKRPAIEIFNSLKVHRVSAGFSGRPVGLVHAQYSIAGFCILLLLFLPYHSG